MVEVSSVKVFEKFRVALEFSDGVHKVVDLEPFLCGPIFEPIRTDPNYF